uniref:Chlorophyll a-b binding protein, chloroplastic n=1 Tax=Tetradesmus obliquus TaxID=3088 RepID=A0A383VMX0_TETOB|eukprot:jgi/Sobl393_1/11262/SZX66064.1
MMLSTKTAPAAAARGLRSSGLPARAAAAPQRNVIVRFREDKRPASASDTEQLKEQLSGDHNGPKDPKITAEQMETLRYKEPGMKQYWPSSTISPESAEERADMGTAADFWQMQVFDGPAPETINGRMSMLGVLIGLIGEWTTGLGLMEQTADHPLIVFGSFLLISFASYAPIARGYTRKEPYANHLLGFNWTPRAENWNGRIAMLGFAGMVLTEWITGVNTLQAWGLQGINFPGL